MCSSDGSLPSTFYIFIALAPPVLGGMYYFFLCRPVGSAKLSARLGLDTLLASCAASVLGFSKKNKWMLALDNGFAGVHAQTKSGIYKLWDEFVGTPEKAFELSMSFKIVASFIQVTGSLPKNLQADWCANTKDLRARFVCTSACSI